MSYDGIMPIFMNLGAPLAYGMHLYGAREEGIFNG